RQPVTLTMSIFCVGGCACSASRPAASHASALIDAYDTALGFAAKSAKGDKSNAAAQTAKAAARAFLCLCALGGTALPARAQDAEHPQAVLTFAPDGAFTLDVSNDPAWLKLRLASIEGPFVDRIVLWVDGHEVRPTSTEVIAGETLTTYRMRGRMPTNAR